MSFMTHMHKIIQLKITCTTANKINGTEKIGLKVFGYATATNATNVKKIINANVIT